MNYTDIRKKTKKDTWSQNVKHKQGSTNIRAAARKDYRNFDVKDYMERCWICGKEGKTDIMHLKASSEFLPEALVGEINHPMNIVCGCGNCHRKYDKPKFKNIDWYLHKQQVILKAMEYASAPQNRDIHTYYEEFESPINLSDELWNIQQNIAKLKGFYDTDGGCSVMVKYIGTKASDKVLARYRAMTKKEALVEPIGCSQYTKIRAAARNECYKHKIPDECCVSGCTERPQVGHLIPMPDWPDETPLGIINHPDNMRPMCSNHHAMFDLYKAEDPQKYAEFLEDLDKGYSELGIKYKPIGKVRYIYNKHNPSNWSIVEPRDIGKEKGFWE